MPTTLSILVFVASPLDYARYRHTALYFEFDTGVSAELGSDSDSGSDVKSGSDTPTPPREAPIKSALMEVVGSMGFFSFFERVNSDLPISSTELASVIRVAITPVTISVSALRGIVSKTPIPVGEADWNSQNWVGDALDRLVVAGYLDRKTRDRGLDEMVDVIMEAGDEEIK